MERDAQAIAGIYAPAITDAVISFELTPPDAREISRRMLAIQRQYPWLVYEESKAVLGYVYASVHNERAAYRWSVDVTAYIQTRCASSRHSQSALQRAIRDPRASRLSNSLCRNHVAEHG